VVSIVLLLESVDLILVTEDPTVPRFHPIAREPDITYFALILPISSEVLHLRR
jgi:hypothetical protein